MIAARYLARLRTVRLVAPTLAAYVDEDMCLHLKPRIYCGRNVKDSRRFHPDGRVSTR